MKLGILGGTFDPVHNGHLKIAVEVKQALGLDQVIFIPAGQSPFKVAYTMTPAEQRLEMLRLAMTGDPGMVISTVETERPGISYTVDTLNELRQQYSDDTGLYFIMGRDSLEKFAEWREPKKIIELASLVVIPRPGWIKPDLEALEKSIRGISSRVIFLDSPEIDISSTAIRELVSIGKPIENLVPGSIAEYINEHDLYRQ